MTKNNPLKEKSFQFAIAIVSAYKQIVEKNGAIFTPNLLVLFEDFARHNRLRVSETVFWRVFFFGKWLERFEVTIL